MMNDDINFNSEVLIFDMKCQSDAMQLSSATSPMTNALQQSKQYLKSSSFLFLIWGPHLFILMAGAAHTRMGRAIIS